MIILHRITVLLQIGIVSGLFFTLLQSNEHVLLYSILAVFIFSLLQGRLLGFDFRSWSFWIFFLTPIALFAGSVFFFLFLELILVKWLVILLTIALLWLYLENIFIFYYLPGMYQPYSLEYISFAIYLLFVFFFAGGMYAFHIFLSLPIVIPFLALFWVILCTSVCMFWVSKVHTQTSLPYAFVGAIGFSQLYVALLWLPIGFIVSATALTVGYYTYLGLVRAHVFETLSPLVARRYMGILIISFILIFATTAWT